MAFKMKGFSAGEGTGSHSAFKKKQEAEASPLTAKPPSWADGVKIKDRKGSGDQKGKVWTKTGVDSEGADEFGYLDKKDARKSERKQRKAEKLRAKAERLREKKGGKGEKRAARLEKRAASKEIRADVKEKMASNIQQGKDKKADLVDPRGGQTPGYKHRVENPKVYDSKGEHIKGTGEKPKKNEPVKKDPPPSKPTQTFDEAFAAARKAGKKTFQWSGEKTGGEMKSFHTRRADESKEDWEKKFNAKGTPSPGKEPEKK